MLDYEIIDRNGEVIRLTHRQFTILSLVAAGKQNKEISYEMKLPHQTVKNYLSGIYKKIGVYNRTQAAVWLVENARFVNS